MEFRRFPWLLTLCVWPAVSALAVQPDTQVVPAASNLQVLQPLDRANAAAGSQGPVVDNAILKKNPQLAAELLNQAVEESQWPVVSAILPVYEQSPQADRSLVLYARAGLAHSRGEYPQAIAAYRTLLAEHPEYVRVRLDLAKALFEDRQYPAARWNFEQARSQNPPPEVLDKIDSYLEFMEKRAGWSGNFSLSYLNDSNVNNASNDKYITIGDRVLQRNPDSYPKRGEGLYFGGLAQRDFQFSDHQNVRFRTTLSGKSYWNNHDYDDITSRVYLGYAFLNARQQLALLPFYEKRWYGTNAYSKGAGVRAEYSYLLAPDWQASQAVEYQKLDYDNQNYSGLKGHNGLLSTTLAHAVNTRLSVFTGVDLGQQKTQIDAETNRRLGARLGAETALPYGVSMGLMANLAQKRYQGENDIFQVKRKDNEQIYALSLWHRDFYFFNLMPKINVIYKVVNSNIDFYSYDETNVFLSFDKNF